MFLGVPTSCNYSYSLTPLSVEVVGYSTGGVLVFLMMQNTIKEITKIIYRVTYDTNWDGDTQNKR